MFDEILADCLEALAEGATIRDCLTRYPAEAATLEPLLRLAVALGREGETRLSPGAFRQGRRLLMNAARTRQTQFQQKSTIHHRQPRHIAPAAPLRRPPFPPYQQIPPYQQNGRQQSSRPVRVKPAQQHVKMPPFLRMAFVLLAVVGATTFIRLVTTSLPGTWLYPVKSSSERMVGRLMTAAGEAVAWQENQLAQRLQELTGLTDANATATSVTTVQSAAHAVESDWQALLTASEGLTTNERTALLQAQIARFQQLEARWAGRQEVAPQVAVMTLRRLIAAGEAALATPTPLEEAATGVVTATATTSIPTSTMTPTTSATATPTITATPLLQPSATAPAGPILEPSPTATPTPVPPIVTPVIPSPTLPPTPLPEITVQIPREESSEQEQDDHNNDGEASGAEAPTATPTPLTPEATQTGGETATPALGVGPEEETPAPTVLSTEVAATPTTADQSPTVTSGEGVWPLPTKSVAPATATPEPDATNTPRPTNPPNATKTPKATATQAPMEPATPNAPTAAPVMTTVPPTPMERTPNATTQPPVATKEVGTETAVAPPTARATTSSSEATRTPQP